MHRKLNRKLLLWTLGSLLLAGVVVHLVHGLQVRRNAGRLLANADRAWEAGGLVQPLPYYNHYLTYEPEDTAALAKYGLALEQHANTPAERLRVVLTFEQV